MNAITIEDLTKVYRIYASPRDRLKELFSPTRARYHDEFFALRNVSLTVARGETVGIVGRNGSGKSTMLKIISGVLQPTSGRLAVDGRLAALLELGAGFNPEFTGRENIQMHGALLGLRPREIAARMPAIEAFAEIGAFIDQPLKIYSNGMFVRLAFAAAINSDPDVFIVDEALAVGDARFVHRCMLRFREMQAQRKTILFVSHDAAAVRALCQRAVWLEGGIVRSIGDANRVVDEYLAHLFKQPRVPVDGRQRVEQDSAKAADPLAVEEQRLPNIDRRLGDRSCVIVGAGLYGPDMEPTKGVVGGADAVLRITIENRSVGTGNRLAVGYILRTHRGEELASTNTKIERVDIPWRPIGERLTIRLRITLPMLHPGSYAFSPTAGYIRPDGEIVIGDRVENAIVFEIASDTEIHVLMRLKTEITIESLAAQ